MAGADPPAAGLTPDAVADARTSLGELAALFLKLGTFGFGGPAAHVALMQDEVVRRRGWLDEQRFLDLVGACNLIPGPTSTELAIHIGWERRRWAGLWVAGVAFITPAALITAACGQAYVRYGAVPAARGLLHGIKPVMVAIVAQALLGLGPRAARTPGLRTLGVAAVVAAALGLDELGVLFGAGALWAALAGRRGAPLGALPALAPLPAASAAAGALSIAGGAVATTSATWPALFWVFCKIGSVLFGSGYVLLAFLRADLVERLGWLTEAQLLDAVAVGQLTPGPVFTTATFIGWVLAGPAGAAAATAGIFLPAFVLVALSGPLVPRLRASRLAGAFLDGINVASLALMAVVTAQLARAAVVDAPTVALLGAALVALLRFRVNATWLIAGGALVGLGLERLGWLPG